MDRAGPRSDLGQRAAQAMQRLICVGTCYDAAVLGMNALNVPRWHDNPNLKIQVRVRQPETVHEVWNHSLSALLARAAKSPKEQALKARLRELVRG